MPHLFHRTIKGHLPVAVAGDGPYIIDDQGKRYIDASGGAAVSCLGHSNEAVKKAIIDQVQDLPFAHTGFFTSKPAEALGDFLIDRAPEGLGWVYFLSGGSEAVEAALKMARQYFVEKGEPQRTKYIARLQSYHGNTLGALAVGGNQWRREPFKPLLVETTHVSPCYDYRHRLDGETEEQYGERLAQELEDTIIRLGADQVAAFVAETVVGATAGALPPVKGYFKRIREVCDKYGVLLILDEVMSGMGRTGTLFACEQDGISPDLLTIAKGLGAGYQPIGALLVSDKLYQTFAKGSGFFQHGHTYMGHPTACAAALAVQREIEEKNLLDNVMKQGQALDAALKARFADNPYIGDYRGRGLFRAIEIVEDKATKDAFDPAHKINIKIKKFAMEEGMVCYPGGGTVDGVRGDHVLLAPPFIIDQSHVDEIVTKLGIAVDKALNDVV